MNHSSPAAGGLSRVAEARPSSSSRSQPIRLVIVDDHPVFLEGLSRVLTRQADFSVVGVAAGGQEALQVWERHRPDVLVLDLMMSNLDGIESLRRLRRDHADCRVLILTSSDDPANASAALAAGACGYITKTARYEEIVAAIRDVHAGNACGARGVRAAPAAVASMWTGLTAREVEVLSLVRQGCGNEEIGRKLGISMRTAKSHVATILDKLGATDRAEAVSRGFELGIFTAPRR